MGKQSATKPTETAYEAAQKLIDKKQHEEILHANEKLSALIRAWENETGCTFLLTGHFSGQQIQAGLQVVKQPKQ